MKGFKKYGEYKKSGVEWIGEIPAHWEVRRLKYLGEIYAGLSGKKGDDFSKSEIKGGKPFIPFVNIYKNFSISEDDFQYVKVKGNENQNRVKRNDILFLMSSETLEDIGKCSIYLGENKELYLNSFCKGFRINEINVNPEFINYLLSGSLYRTYFSLVGRGFTRINIKQDYVNNLLTLLPPLPEQTTIARFLDAKTAQIDEYIRLKEKTIALLEERKAALINQAVTRGLDPTVKMKPSGVEWLGEVPEGWEVKKLKYVCQIIDCKHITPIYTEEGIPIVSTGNVKPGIISMDSIRKVSESDFKLLSEGERLPKYPDIIYSRNASVGAAAMVKKDDFFCLGQDICLLRSKINAEFLEIVLNSQFMATQLEQELVGSTFKRINISQMKEFFILTPDEIEQKKIFEYLNKKGDKIDDSINTHKTQIALIKEYRQSLISAAVTGQVDVRGWGE